MNDKMHTDLARRAFLAKGSRLAAGIAVAPGVVLYTSSAAARPADQPASSDNRWGMLVDANKCSKGCDACVTACQKENGWGENETKSRDSQQAQWIRKVELKHMETGKSHSLPVMCQHCEKPPCVDVCPTGASMKRDDGIVLVDKHICIGCRYCMMACPYKARSFIHESLENQEPHAPRGKGTVESCTMCVHLVDQGEIPACVAACQANGTNAIIFGDLKDPNSAVSQALANYDSTAIRADLGLNPGVRYRGI